MMRHSDPVPLVGVVMKTQDELGIDFVPGTVTFCHFHLGSASGRALISPYFTTYGKQVFRIL
jgi:hypothetical protein